MSTRRAKELRRDMTEAEKLLWSRLRARALDGHYFRRQAPIGPYIVDFVCHGRSLIVELDGGQHGDGRDAERSRWLHSRGYRVVRFWNNEVMANTDAVLRSIQTTLDQ